MNSKKKIQENKELSKIEPEIIVSLKKKLKNLGKRHRKEIRFIIRIES